MTEIAASRAGLLKFNLAVQRARAIVFALTIPIFILGKLGRALEAPFLPYLIFISIAIVTCFIFSALYKHYDRLGRDVPLHRIWMPVDVLIAVFSIHFSGGLESPWWIFFLTNSSTAAFVRGRAATWAVSIGNGIGYFALLFLTGEITGANETLFLPGFRLAFLYVSSFFLLTGIANIQEKRALIQQLREEERRKIEQLTRLTGELDERTRELGEANRLIKESDRAKSQFLANMSHELRTPMNSIIGFSEILIDRLEKDISPRYVEFLRHILSAGQHLLGIINDILDLSKIEAGKMEVHAEYFAIGPTIDGICTVMKSDAAKQQMQIVSNVPRDLPLVEADLPKFKQVMFNLLSNAVKFSAAGSTITIDAKHDPAADTVTVSVTDQGIGIAPEHQQMIFEEFRQVDSSSRRQQGGTGLGLALVRKFMELQGGSVAVESEPGKGSRFSISLPVRFQGVRDPARIFLEHADELQSGDRVLVVEDDIRAFESIRAHLQSAGYVAINARHADEAIDLARKIKPVAITLDLILPGSDGWEVLKKLKADEGTASIPVVIISMIDQRELGFALGAHDYFLKPVDRARLVERLQQVTGAQRHTRPKLLVIDDDESFRLMLNEELSHLGYDIVTAENGTRGVELANEETPDVIILDLMMPGMSGFEVAEVLKSNPKTANIAILVMTAKEITSEDREQLHTKISALVPKGQTKARLIAAIQSVEMRARRSQFA